MSLWDLGLCLCHSLCLGCPSPPLQTSFALRAHLNPPTELPLPHSPLKMWVSLSFVIFACLSPLLKLKSRGHVWFISALFTLSIVLAQSQWLINMWAQWNPMTLCPISEKIQALGHWLSLPNASEIKHEISLKWRNKKMFCGLGSRKRDLDTERNNFLWNRGSPLSDLPPRGPLAMSGNTFACFKIKRRSWHLVGGCRDAAKHPVTHRSAPATRSDQPKVKCWGGETLL